MHLGRPSVGQSNVLPAEHGLHWEWCSATPPRSLHLWLYPDFVNDVARDLSVGRVESVEVRHGFDEDDDTLRTLTSALADCLAEPDWFTLRAESIAFHAAAHLMQRYGDTSDVRRHTATRPLDPVAMRRVHDFIYDHLGTPLRLEQLAEVAGLSRGHFSRAFRLACGLSPYRYVLAARIEQALARLSIGEPPIDVASAVGFADQSHLTRWLRNTVGATPGEIVRGKRASMPRWRTLD